MNRIKVKFFGISSITLDNTQIDFPFSKAESILYLLLYERTVSRDMLSTLLWGDMDEISAKKNLRNATYVIRKQIQDDIIISPKRSLIEINSKYEIISDIDFINKFDSCNIVKMMDVEEFIKCYDGSFLEKLRLKSEPRFTEWIDATNLRIRNIYINKLKILSNTLINNKEFHFAEICCRKLIELEEYDEAGYADLMTIYLSQNKYQKAMDLYNSLVEKLNNDLSVKTSKETDEIYEKVLKKMKLKVENKSLNFYGRDNEKKRLLDNIYNFIGNKAFKSFIISGEDGIGKSLLLNDIARELEFNILLIKISCYEYETDFIFKFWDKVFQQISNIVKDKNINLPKKLLNIISNFFPTLEIKSEGGLENAYSFLKSDLAENAIFDLFGLLSNKLKIIFIVDDINNADKASLELLYKTILANRFKIMLIATNRDENEKLDDKLFNSLRFNNLIEKIHLERFNREETLGFINIVMPEALSEVDQIYSESEGNPLFIIEILNNIKSGNTNNYMTNKIETLIHGRLLNVSAEANKLLSICSLFQDIFFVEMLSKITDMRSIELIELIEELLSKEMLKEEISTNGKLGLTFTHRKIREYIYKSTSNSKRIILHAKIAEYYEDELFESKKVNRTFYPEMIYHFSSSNNMCKFFKYKIKWLEEILDFKHEIFPVTESSISTALIEYYLDEKSLEKEFAIINELYRDLSCSKCKDCIEEEILYLYLYGRFNKNRGNVIDGLELLNKAIYLSEENNNHELAYNCYLQLAHYYVNINDTKSMGETLDKAEEVSILLGNRCKMAVVWRLKGYLNILLGRYEEGEKYINKALEIFNLPENKDRYLLNIVAALFYIGEKFRIQSSYESALEYYEKSLELCNENEEDCPAAALIFSKIGYVKYKQEILDEAQFYFLKSLKAYEKSIFVWGRIDVYYYLYKIYENKKMMAKANRYLKDSLEYIDKYTSEELKDKIYEILNSQT